MTTTLRDAKIQVTLDTKEAERALKRLDSKMDPGKLQRLRGIAGREKRDTLLGRIKEGAKDKVSRFPGMPGMGSKLGVAAKVAGGTYAAYKAMQYVLPAVVSMMSEAMDDISEIALGEAPGLGTKHQKDMAKGLRDQKKELNITREKMNEVANVLDSLESQVTALNAAQKAVSSAVKMNFAVGVDMGADFYLEMARRNYMISANQKIQEKVMTRWTLQQGGGLLAKKVVQGLMAGI